MKSHIEHLFYKHPYLRKDAYLASAGKKREQLVIVIVDRQPRHMILTKENYELIVKIFENTNGSSIRTALVDHIPSFDHFIEAGGKRHSGPPPYYKVTFSGDTGEVWTIGGMFRGRVDPEDARRIQWIQREDDTV